MSSGKPCQIFGTRFLPIYRIIKRKSLKKILADYVNVSRKLRKKERKKKKKELQKKEEIHSSSYVGSCTKLFCSLPKLSQAMKKKKKHSTKVHDK